MSDRSKYEISFISTNSFLFSLMEKVGIVKRCCIPYRALKNVPLPEQELLAKSNFLVVAAWPKSGSTYLTRLLSALTGHSLGHFVQFYGHNEQDLCEYRMIDALGKRKMIHQHIKAGNNNILLMKKYNIKPVVLVRNIFDTLISLNDHFERESTEWPGGYIHNGYMQFSFEEKMDFLTKIVAPWYFNFYISWVEAEDKIDVMWITYDELFSLDQDNIIKKILSFWGIEATEDEIKENLRNMKNCNTRFNVGRTGRGLNLLPFSCKEEIIALAKVWKLPSEIFKRIGIE